MRKETIITLQDTNIKGEPIELTFKIKQMSALKQERWFNRVIMLLMGAGPSLSDVNLNQLQNEMQSKGLQYLFELFGKLNYKDIEPLYNELLTCCSYIPNPDKPNTAVQCTVQNIDSFISDFLNLYRLRAEVLKLHFSFLPAGVNFQQPQQQQEIVFTKRT